MKRKGFKEFVNRRKGIFLTDNRINTLQKQIDGDIQSKILKDVENNIKLESNKEKVDYNILRKYLWLQELIKWNKNPISSKIRFEQLELKHLK
jgi:hypothetical protein